MPDFRREWPAWLAALLLLPLATLAARTAGYAFQAGLYDRLLGAGYDTSDLVYGFTVAAHGAWIAALLLAGAAALVGPHLPTALCLLAAGAGVVAMHAAPDPTLAGVTGALVRAAGVGLVASVAVGTGAGQRALRVAGLIAVYIAMNGGGLGGPLLQGLGAGSAGLTGLLAGQLALAAALVGLAGGLWWKGPAQAPAAPGTGLRAAPTAALAVGALALTNLAFQVGFPAVYAGALPDAVANYLNPLIVIVGGGLAVAGFGGAALLGWRGRPTAIAGGGMLLAGVSTIAFAVESTAIVIVPLAALSVAEVLYAGTLTHRMVGDLPWRAAAAFPALHVALAAGLGAAVGLLPASPWLTAALGGAIALAAIPVAIGGWFVDDWVAGPAARSPDHPSRSPEW